MVGSDGMPADDEHVVIVVDPVTFLHSPMVDTEARATDEQVESENVTAADCELVQYVADDDGLVWVRDRRDMQ